MGQLTFETLPSVKYAKEKLFITEDRSRTQFLYEIHDRGYMKDAWKISMCRNTFAGMNNGFYDLDVPCSCQKNVCPDCAIKNGIRNSISLKSHLMDVKGHFQNLRFVTLTYKSAGSKEELNSQFLNLPKDVRAYIRIMKTFGYNILSGYRATEVVTHEKGAEKYKYLESGQKFYTGEFYDKTEHHLHIHMLYFAVLDDSINKRRNFNKFVEEHKVMKPDAQKYRLNKNKYLDYDFCFIRQNEKDGFVWNDLISSVWEKASHNNSSITDPKRVSKDMTKAVNYIAKYVGKGFYDSTLSPSVNADVFEVTKGKRLIQKFGAMFKDFSVKKYTKGSLYHKDDVVWYEDILLPYDDANKFTFGYVDFGLDPLSMLDVVFIREGT